MTETIVYTVNTIQIIIIIKKRTNLITERFFLLFLCVIWCHQSVSDETDSEPGIISEVEAFHLTVNSICCQGGWDHVQQPTQHCTLRQAWLNCVGLRNWTQERLMLGRFPLHRWVQRVLLLLLPVNDELDHTVCRNLLYLVQSPVRQRSAPGTGPVSHGPAVF